MLPGLEPRYFTFVFNDEYVYQLCVFLFSYMWYLLVKLVLIDIYCVNINHDKYEEKTDLKLYDIKK